MRILLGVALTTCCILCTPKFCPADDRSLALDIVNRAIKAHGGDEVLLKSQRMLRKNVGTMSFLGKDMPFSAT